MARRIKQRVFGGSMAQIPTIGLAYIIDAGIAPGTSSFSFDFWAKIGGDSYAEAATHQLCGILTSFYATTGCLVSQNGSQLLFYSNPGTAVAVVLPSSVCDTWAHYVIVYDSVVGVSFYLNGVLLGIPQARSCNITGTQLELGRGGLAGLKSGNIGAFRYWKGVALTATQIAAMFYDDLLPSTPYCDARYGELAGATMANYGTLGVNFTVSSPTTWNIDTPGCQPRNALQNLLKYSNDPSNAAWVQTGLASIAVSPLSHPTRTGGVVWRLTENTANTAHYIYQTMPAALAGRPIQGAFKVRGGGGRGFVAADAGNYINLSTGAVAASGANNVVSVSDLGNGWYQVRWTAPAYNSNQGFYLSSASGVVTYLGNGSYIDICDFSIELQTGVSSEFLETTTSPALAATGASLPSQNLQTYSNTLSTGWSGTGAAVASGTAWSVSDSSAAAFQYWQAPAVPAGSLRSYTAGCLVKKTSGGTSPTFGLNYAAGGSAVTLRFNSDNGYVIDTNARSLRVGSRPVTYGGEDYWLVWTTFQATTNVSITLQVYPAVGPNGGSTVGVDAIATTGSAIVRDFFCTETLTPPQYVEAIASAVNTVVPRGFMPQQNLIRFSSDMTQVAAFALTNLTSIVALGNVGPGGMPAFRMTDNVGAGGHYTTQTISPIPTVGRAYTLSANVRAGTKTAIVLAPEGAGFQVTYDLTAGTATTSIGAPIGTAITALGDGWYRCSLTFVSAGASGYRFYISPTSYVADGTGTMDWCGIQLTEASGVANYIASSTTISEGAPRGQMARQNFLLYSEDYTQAAWTKQAGTVVTPNDTAAPDGTMTASTIDVTAAAANQGIFQVASVVAQAIGQTLTRSVWVKGTLGETVKISDPSMTTGTTTVTFTGAWQRESLSEAALIGGSGIWLRKGTASTFKMWGAQISSTQGLAPYVRTGAVATTGGIQTPRSQIA